MTEPIQDRILQAIEALIPDEGMIQTALPGVKIVRANSGIASMPVCEPCIVIVCHGIGTNAGSKATWPERRHEYVVLPVALPVESFLQKSCDGPIFAMSIPIDLKMAAELVLTMDGIEYSPPAGEAAGGPTPLDERMSDTTLRLLSTMRSPIDTWILGPCMVRELLYRVLSGPQGNLLRSGLGQQSHFGRIGKALRRIHENYDEPVDVAMLARDAGMSIAAFHAHFKMVTHTSPIQYLKTTRLQKARLMMIQDGLGAAAASRRVGYESSSQFSREFKRLFGRTPTEETAIMKNTLHGMQPAQPRAPATWPDFPNGTWRGRELRGRRHGPGFGPLAQPSPA